MSEFTKDKWSWNKNYFEQAINCIPVITPTRRHIAYVFGNRYDSETQANASLIAAAPEMYELLKMLNESSNDIEVSNVILNSKKLLARIDGEEAEA